MSEYQYYEFQAVDRPFTEEQMRQLRAISSRATITRTRFTNFYTWGDFKGDPEVLMEQYFDAFVYVANWGTHELMLRLPRRLLRPAVVRPYCAGESCRMWSTVDHVILDIQSEDESRADVDEDDGDGWMSALLPLRAEIASGDHRGLYLGWLCSVQAGQLEDEALEPSLPAGLLSLSTAQQALAAFLRLDTDLLSVASEASQRAVPGLSRHAIKTWVRGLADSDKTDLLVRMVTDDQPHHLHAELVQRVMQASDSGADEASAGSDSRRSVGDLLGAAARRSEARKGAAAERTERERQREEHQRAAARAVYLKGLVGHEDELWQQIDSLVATKRQTDYDQAVRVIRDLADVATRADKIDTFASRLAQLCTRHAKKVTLLERLASARLLPEQTEHHTGLM